MEKDGQDHVNVEGSNWLIPASKTRKMNTPVNALCFLMRSLNSGVQRSRDPSVDGVDMGHKKTVRHNSFFTGVLTPTKSG